MNDPMEQLNAAFQERYPGGCNRTLYVGYDTPYGTVTRANRFALQRQYREECEKDLAALQAAENYFLANQQQQENIDALVNPVVPSSLTNEAVSAPFVLPGPISSETVYSPSMRSPQTGPAPEPGSRVVNTVNQLQDMQNQIPLGAPESIPAGQFEPAVLTDANGNPQEEKKGNPLLGLTVAVIALKLLF